MEQQSSAKQNFFSKSPEIPFAESPALSLFRGWSKTFLSNCEPMNLIKQPSNFTIRKPSSKVSSNVASPYLDHFMLMNKSPGFLLQDSKPMPALKLDFVPFGSPEVNFVLGPSALEIKISHQKKNEEESVFKKHTC